MRPASGSSSNSYCYTCHSERAKAAGLDSARKLTLDSLDTSNVARDAKTWELVARKLRAGMMPPAGMPRPEPATYESMSAWLESELDRHATPYTPPPGLHRLNRTEYANSVRDLLDLPIDPAKYLPSDDSTSGFDNIAGALGISSTLVEAYVTAAQKISRLAVGEAEEPTLVVYRAREDTTQDYHVEGLPFGTRGGLLVEHLFPSDGEYTITMTPIFGDNMTPTGFGSVPCERIEVLLDGERLGLMDWNGGGRAPATECRGERQAASRTGQAGPEAFFGNGAPMRVRFKTTAGSAQGWRDLPGHAVRAAARSRPPLPRSTIQTGPTPGYTFFPHVGTIRIEGPFSATRATNSPSRRKIFACTPARPADEEACARRIAQNLATQAFRRPDDGGRRRRADGFLSARAPREGFRARASRWCSRGSWPRRSSSTASRKSRPASRRADVSHQRHRSGVAAVVLPVEQPARRGAADGGAAGTSQGSGRPRAAGAADARASEGEGAHRRTSRASG